MACLNVMSEEKGEDVEFLQYTKLWVEQVNRGGLFQVNNDAYLIFRAMELASQCVLSVKRVTSHPTLKIQQEMEKAIMNDPSVTVRPFASDSNTDALFTASSITLLVTSCINCWKWRGFSTHSKLLCHREDSSLPIISS